MFVIKTLCLYITTIIIGIFVNSLQSVFNVVGSISTNSIVFILPCLFYFRLVEIKGKHKRLRYYLAKGMFLLFIFFSMFSIASNFITLN